METKTDVQKKFLWALVALVFLKVLVAGIEGWTEIAVLVGEVM
jgi:hypothetical protein